MSHHNTNAMEDTKQPITRPVSVEKHQNKQVMGSHVKRNPSWRLSFRALGIRLSAQQGGIVMESCNGDHVAVVRLEICRNA